MNLGFEPMLLITLPKISENCQFNEMRYLSVNVFVEADDQLNAHCIENGLPSVQLMRFGATHHTSVDSTNTFTMQVGHNPGHALSDQGRISFVNL